MMTMTFLRRHSSAVDVVSVRTLLHFVVFFETSLEKIIHVAITLVVVVTIKIFPEDPIIIATIITSWFISFVSCFHATTKAPPPRINIPPHRAFTVDMGTPVLYSRHWRSATTTPSINAVQGYR